MVSRERDAGHSRSVLGWRKRSGTSGSRPRSVSPSLGSAEVFLPPWVASAAVGSPIGLVSVLSSEGGHDVPVVGPRRSPPSRIPSTLLVAPSSLAAKSGRRLDEERSTIEKLERMKMEEAALVKDVQRMKERRLKQEQVSRSCPRG